MDGQNDRRDYHELIIKLSEMRVELQGLREDNKQVWGVLLILLAGNFGVNLYGAANSTLPQPLQVVPVSPAQSEISNNKIVEAK